MPKDKVYEIRTPLTINVDKEALEKYKEMCHRDHTSLSRRIDEFIKDEVKKVEGLATPIAITYNTGDDNSIILRHPSLYLSRNFGTRTKSYKKFQPDIITLDDYYENKRLLRNADEGLDMCKPNIGRVLTK
jgi:hypothetical protein